MKISELPTPRLRARAMELALGSAGEGDYQLSEAFEWRASDEKHNFWSACNEGNWDRAKELQPSLFKPMDGKPHIWLSGYEGGDGYRLYTTNWLKEGFSGSRKEQWYCERVNPKAYPTIKEAVEALYSFKRGSANEDT